MRSGQLGFVLCWLCAMALLSCRTTGPMVKSGLEQLSAKEILERSGQNRNFGEISSKVNINYEIGADKQGFSAKVRMKQDSIIWVSVAPLLGIEIVRAVITADSLKLVDRFNKRYYLGRFDRLSQMLGVDLNFAMLQSLITGNNIDLYGMERYEARPHETMYLIQSAEIGRKKSRKGSEPKVIGQQTWIEPAHFSVSRSMVTDPATQSSLEANYSNPQLLGKVHFPERMALRIEGKQQAKVDMQWMRPTSESGLEFPFSIPSGYDEIK